MSKTLLQMLRDVTDAFDPAAELADDGRYAQLAGEYIKHDAPTITELREKVLDASRRMIEDNDPFAAPRWDTAPSWASWLAQDYDANWFWYDKKPKPGVGREGWVVEDDSRSKVAKRPTSRAANSAWHGTLQAKPAPVGLD
ncbi:TPA: hypothetical protein ACP3ZG_001597 [Pseudomonas aeruginosa]|uniref:Uncharacterized protein n=1 Tax=Pseudomonas aeruginosa TaxID=287 RepID=A0A241XS59_PSEAI|nr:MULTISPECIES: hypothetical protein [Pseudomonas]ELG7182105.1 hypothetical protein [Pseudomonas aeruginosa]MBH4094962.1 hypothetical protein [Pseudomonas aeruginosa]MBI6603321.1 hypothetical protein [Pseudomonas sp. S4_EA_1b]MBI8852516.1 hypothetical protein [Pseudomonas aeruginosa]OTI63254.1 hypothetical protein CAZ10_10515 [Pseudomonas aeruginosa]